MKALSIRQPWASLIVSGIPINKTVDAGNGMKRLEYSGQVFVKNIENRTRPLPTRAVGQRVYVHAGQRHDPEAFEWLLHFEFCPAYYAMVYSSPRLPRGIIGEVDIVDCVTESSSPWFQGPYGWVLANPVAYSEPIPCRGALGFFEIPAGVLP